MPCEEDKRDISLYPISSVKILRWQFWALYKGVMDTERVFPRACIRFLFRFPIVAAQRLVSRLILLVAFTLTISILSGPTTVKAN